MSSATSVIVDIGWMRVCKLPDVNHFALNASDFYRQIVASIKSDGRAQANAYISDTPRPSD